MFGLDKEFTMGTVLGGLAASVMVLFALAMGDVGPTRVIAEVLLGIWAAEAVLIGVAAFVIWLWRRHHRVEPALPRAIIRSEKLER